MKKIALTTAVVVGSIITTTGYAAFPTGLWQVQQYDFVSKKKVNTMQTCILDDGTFAQGSTMSSINWSGNWKQAGDLVLLRMNEINGSGVATYSLLAATENLMTGYNQSFDYYDGTADGFYISSVWNYMGDVCQP